MTASEEITVEVHLHAILRQWRGMADDGPLQIALAAGQRVGDLPALLQLPLNAETVLFVVNGDLVTSDQPLSAGDVVHLIPPVSGGIPPIGMKTLM